MFREIMHVLLSALEQHRSCLPLADWGLWATWCLAEHGGMDAWRGRSVGSGMEAEEQQLVLVSVLDSIWEHRLSIQVNRFSEHM